MSTVATVPSPGVVDFAVEALQEGVGHHLRRASAVLQQALANASRRRTTWPPLKPTLAAWTVRICAVALTSVCTWSGLHRPGRGLCRGGCDSQCWPNALPGSIRSQQGQPPGLLDACFQSVGAHPDSQSVAAYWCRWGAPSPCLCSGAYRSLLLLMRVTKVELSVSRPISIVDAHGTVLLAVCGLRIWYGSVRARQTQSGAE